MHELGIAMSILEIAENAARQDGASTIRAIGVRVGAFSGVVPDALEFAFQAARTGTLAEHARLEITVTPMVAHCAGCNLDFNVDDPHGVALCPVCLKPVPGVQHGQELTVTHLEVA
jgi:hydrogenase nickel incorporation protein HypA/HybF